MPKNYDNAYLIYLSELKMSNLGDLCSTLEIFIK